MSIAPIVSRRIFQGNYSVFGFLGVLRKKLGGDPPTTVECGRLEPETDKSAQCSVEPGFYRPWRQFASF